MGLCSPYLRLDLRSGLEEEAKQKDIGGSLLCFYHPSSIYADILRSKTGVSSGGGAFITEAAL